MQRTIQEWLADPKRKYADGLAIFKTAAAPEIKRKYGEYFSSIEGEPEQFDMHFGMLVNKVSDIERKIRINPEAFNHLKLIVATTDNTEEIAAKEAEISELKAAFESLLSETQATEDITEIQDKLLLLETELEALKTQRGISIVQYDNLPADIKKFYDRVKVITPLMASLHAEISVESLHPNTRKGLVKQLCELDDERRSAWDQIDTWSEGKPLEPAIETPTYSNDKLVKGLQIARRMERLKENIIRSKQTVDISDRETIKQAAIARVVKYETELAELQALLTAVDEQGTV